MTKTELLELIANGENSGVEFKLDDIRAEQLAREVVALANFNGGRILLGVGDDGAITGTQRDDVECWVMDAVFGRKVHPQILPYYEEVRFDDGRIVAVITLTQGTAKPYVVRHNDREEIYVRIGSTSRLATREQQARLFSVGGMIHAELLPVSGSRFQDLCKERLTDYILNIIGEPKAPVPTVDAWAEQLCGLGFMAEREDGLLVCTIAGLILFGLRPRRLLRQAGVRWMAFGGDDKSYNAIDDQVMDGPLIARFEQSSDGHRMIVEMGLIERLIQAMRPFVSEEASELDDNIRRKRHWHYPLDAIREGVVNSLAHRDWTRNEEVEVISYADRLEVLSPGALPNTMTLAKMITGQRSPRNSIVVDVLHDYGYVDGRGMGVRKKIIPLLQQANGVAPEFEVTEDYVRLRMQRSL